MTKQVAAFALFAAGVAGCSGHAELLKHDPSGGIIALRGDRRQAMEDAKAQMAANCQNGFELTGEELDRVAESAPAESEPASDTNATKKDAPKSAKSVHGEVKEYRILYECRK